MSTAIKNKQPIVDKKRMFEYLKKQIIEKSYKTNKRDNFTLSTGIKSVDFFDIKQLCLYPPALNVLIRYIRTYAVPTLYKDALPDTIGGPLFGAVPIIISLSNSYFIENGEEIFPVIVRKEKKEYGSEQHVEATSCSSTSLTMLLVDDVITSGNSLIKTVRALREFGYKPDHCITIVDRQEGGREKLENEGVEFISLFTADQFRPQ